ncbi:hypothetical protein D3C72_2246650 [compost metagenome]
MAVGAGLPANGGHCGNSAADLPVLTGGAGVGQAGDRVPAQRRNDLPDAGVYYDADILSFGHHLAAAGDAGLGAGDFLQHSLHLGNQGRCGG